LVSRIPQGLKKIRRKLSEWPLLWAVLKQRNLVAARHWIAVLARKRAGTKTKKLSLARRRNDANFFRQKWEKVRGRLNNWAESLDRNWLIARPRQVSCCKTRIFVFFLSCCQVGYWSSFSGRRRIIRIIIIRRRRKLSEWPLLWGVLKHKGIV